MKEDLIKCLEELKFISRDKDCKRFSNGPFFIAIKSGREMTVTRKSKKFEGDGVVKIIYTGSIPDNYEDNAKLLQWLKVDKILEKLNNRNNNEVIRQ